MGRPYAPTGHNIASVAETDNSAICKPGKRVNLLRWVIRALNLLSLEVLHPASKPKVIFRARTCRSIHSSPNQSGDDYLMNETRRKQTTGRQSPSPDKCIVYAQSYRHGWTYQGLCLPSHTDTAGHTKAFDYPVIQTRLDIPRSWITQSHRHGWTYQGLCLPSHIDTAGHTKAFVCPVIQTRLDIPRPLITQSYRHGWTYQGLWLPSHTDTAGHTKAFVCPVT